MGCCKLQERVFVGEKCRNVKSVYARFKKWQKTGVWGQLFRMLSSYADMENLSIDSTMVKVHQNTNGSPDKGANQKQSVGQEADSTRAIELLSQLPIENSNILGDKTYGIQKIRTYITVSGAVYTIPPKVNTKEPWECDYWLYKERHLVECFFQKIK